MPTSPANPIILLPSDKPNIAGGMPATGVPLTGFAGLKLQYPLSKTFMSGAVRRDMDGVQFGAGGTLTLSTTYSGYCIIPRACLITAVYIVLQTSPTVAATFNVTYNGVSLLLGGAQSIINSTYTAGQLYSIPLVITGPLVVTTLPDANNNPGKVLPYLSATNGANGFPFPVLTTYVEAASGTHSANVNMFLEFEPDDFNG